MRASTEITGLGKRKSHEGPSTDDLRNALALSASQLDCFVSESEIDQRYAKPYLTYLAFLLDTRAKEDVLNFVERLSHQY